MHSRQILLNYVSEAYISTAYYHLQYHNLWGRSKMSSLDKCNEMLLWFMRCFVKTFLVILGAIGKADEKRKVRCRNGLLGYSEPLKRYLKMVCREVIGNMHKTSSVSCLKTVFGMYIEKVNIRSRKVRIRQNTSEHDLQRNYRKQIIGCLKTNVWWFYVASQKKN